ncbi:transcription factor bHLH90 isoform X2 [Ricinus communis]|uniref:transcription factor bHLH90 isoform X2 n=1 Tax=Ricinus communis TaxID=3988 RepID=UPI0007726BF7|nr:transcription factor bHLH90 isoform X2 [Ricinus communis]|eukprot:XP_015578625.1 transcription factor bHLH90 isoform X1 [Ricinus communis]
MKGGNMKGLERALELLRPFVDSKAWDYSVVWKLGDDPSRYIEWMGCCCSGGGGKVKMERGEDKYSVSLCRDVYFKHPISTKACEALAGYPSSMPLYSGIHGEMVTSTQSKWITHANASSDSNSYPVPIGTRVLIPVFGGLIELFAARHIAKDQKIIDYVTAHFNVLKQEAMISHGYPSFSECCIDTFREQNFQNLTSPSHLLGLIPRTHVIYPLYQPNTHSSLEGSSSGSNPSNEHPPFDSHSGYLLENGLLKQTIEKSSGPRKSKNDENLMKQKAGLFLDRNKKKISKAIQKSERDNFPSKNLVTERNRRNRIKDGLYTLRALVPKITKMDIASILGDAIEYIGELQKEKKKLEDELEGIEEEECEKSNAQLPLKLEQLHEGRKPLPPVEIDNNEDSSGFGEKEKIEVQIEVNQIGKREFLIKLFCEKKRGGFGRLMDAIYSLGLQVVDANMTTFNGKVLNILKVETNMKDIQPKKLKESLLKLRG